jgi:hypothetical protein
VSLQKNFKNHGIYFLRVFSRVFFLDFRSVHLATDRERGPRGGVARDFVGCLFGAWILDTSVSKKIHGIFFAGFFHFFRDFEKSFPGF